MGTYISMHDGKVTYSNTPTLEAALAEGQKLKQQLDSIASMVQLKQVLDIDGQKAMNENINLMVKGLFK